MVVGRSFFRPRLSLRMLNRWALSDALQPNSTILNSTAEKKSGPIQSVVKGALEARLGEQRQFCCKAKGEMSLLDAFVYAIGHCQHHCLISQFNMLLFAGDNW